MRLSALPLAAAALIAAALLASSCYVTSQGLRYLSILSKARPAAAILADPGSPPEERLLVERALSARNFALSGLGLKNTKSYTSLVRLESEHLATVVSACGELSFARHVWSYPFVGRLPYRGYFDEADASKEARRLRARGLDAIARPVDAFSTLGFFSDPLFSFMSSYDEAELAELVIHEMTHATIFVRGGKTSGQQFNEELATFAGREGALLYIAEQYGDRSPQLQTTRRARADAEAFAAYLRQTAAQLKSLYDSAESDEKKREGKAAIIARRASEFSQTYDSLFFGGAYRAFPMEKLNNAYLDLYLLYEGEPQLYADYYEKIAGRDFRRFMASLARIAASPELRSGIDPRLLMRRELDMTAQGASK